MLALVCLKYANFVVDSLNGAARTTFAHSDLAIPLAISFYTFHLISYLVDLHAGRIKRASIREFVFYLSYFPHLVAGPIVRAWQFLPQIGKTRSFASDVPLGLYQFVAGIFLKSVVADNIAQCIDPVWDGTATFIPTGADHWIVAGLYYCQIYADFAGYTLMALGMSRLLGYRLPPNFRQPMFAPTLQQFWRRWHMTLSHWLRDYLYKPLGGSRFGRWRTALSLLATMVLGGLWHGAGWTFVVWGALHGVGLVFERFTGLNRSHGVVRSAWLVATQSWVILAWIFFRSPNMHQALSFIGQMWQIAPGAVAVHPSIALGLVFGSCAILQQAYEFAVMRLPRRNIPVVFGITAAVVGVADLVIFAPAKVFIYFRF